MSVLVFFIKQKTAYDRRISDWSSDVCSSDLGMPVRPAALVEAGLATDDELPTLTVDPPRHLETSADRFAVLGDVLPLAPLNEVVSFGDLIVVAGAADAVRALARRRRPRGNDREVASYVPAPNAARVAPDRGRPGARGVGKRGDQRGE